LPRSVCLGCVKPIWDPESKAGPLPCASSIAKSSRLSPIRPSKLATARLEAANRGTRLQTEIIEASGVGQLTSKTSRQIIRCSLCSFVELLYIMQLLVNYLRSQKERHKAHPPFNHPVFPSFTLLSKQISLVSITRFPHFHIVSYFSTPAEL
jgi:hypothetical protein